MIFIIIVFFYKRTEASRNAASVGCNPGPQVCTFSWSWSCERRNLSSRLTVFYDSCIIFKIKKHTIFSPVGLSLSNYHFFLSSGLPFLTAAITTSPTPAAGSLFSCPLILFTEMICTLLAPVLSAQLIMAPTRRPKEIRNFTPEDPPCPRFDILNAGERQKAGRFYFDFPF